MKELAKIKEKLENKLKILTKFHTNYNLEFIQNRYINKIYRKIIFAVKKMIIVFFKNK